MEITPYNGTVVGLTNHANALYTTQIAENATQKFIGKNYVEVLTQATNKETSKK